MAYLLRLLLVCSLSIVGMTFFPNSSSLAVSQLDSTDAFSSALERVNQGDYEKALQDFTAVIDFQDDLRGVAYSDRCLVNLQLHHYTAAKSDCLQAIEFAPDNWEAHLNLGLAYYQLKEYQPALMENQRVIRRNHRDYRAYYNQGLVYFALNDYPKAINSYNSALKFSGLIPQEQQATIYTERGLTYKKLQRYDLAIANFKQVIDLNPQDEYSYFNLACAAYEGKKTLIAIKNFTEVVRLNPDFTQAYMNLAVIYHQLRQDKLALQNTRIVIQKCQQQEDKIGRRNALALEQFILQSQPSRIA
ncbi:TPR repeat-containing protein [Hyella patelloides LEGE 07179]|uniref:TPR repeat-containing protein n=1 Tax=Hyella patelloides LEGE 07179 TaxID=945734 RepID=A0A563VSF2_9CYAN|nr:tetratricopeptide repeat protein [Hyella patelloides]VEP14380.1 TPR repeat-containing protein [Hyella patelloides LEGE 07179]